MSTHLRLLFLSILITPLVGGAQILSPLAAPAAPAASSAAIDETPSLWFVELQGAPLADSGSPAALAKEKKDFRNAAKAAGIPYTERYAFDRLWNGFSIAVNPADLARIRRLPGVANLYPVVTETVPPRSNESADLATALAMTGANMVQSVMGYDGTGIKVAVMDTGLDYDHPDFGGNGTNGSTPFPTARVITGWDFVGDAFNADPTSPAFNPVAVPDNNPDDCNGHGTHVAGIVGANGLVTGVAPGVTFGAYRVFGCAGSTTADIMIAAMERALADGMDVLNMSIGSAFQWPQYPTAEAANRVARQGMVVVASIGNSGANGLYAAGAPGLGKEVIGVASVDNTHIKLRVFTITPDNMPIGFQGATASPSAPTSGTYQMARTGTKTSAADACSPLAAGSLAGKVALIRRGSCTFHVKSLNAQNAGAAGVVLYNNSPGRFAATVAGTPAITIPVVSISDVEGNLINDRLAATDETVWMTWTENTGTFDNPSGTLISSFSSYGLSPDLALKPDLAAPGGLINSTYPLEAGGYATISGTSMASPHVAGAVALLLEARPNVSRPMVKTLLQNTANGRPWWGNPGLGFLDNVHRQGAGLIDIPAAIGTKSTVTPSALPLGESEVGPVSATLTIANASGSAVTYAVSHAPALATNANTNSPGFTTGFASVAFSASSVTVPAGGTASVVATITANPGLPPRYTYGGYLVFTPNNGDPDLRVPYAGVTGDYQSIQVLTSAGYGFPWLAQISGGSYLNRSAGATYTMVGSDVPFVLVHLDHQSRAMKWTVRDAASGKSWHLAFNDEYLPRNSTATGFYALPWDGITVAGNKSYLVPNGTYVLEVEVLKALGNSANPAHVETWTSPPITIARPAP